jgi:hypothetical protein
MSKALSVRKNGKRRLVLVLSPENSRWKPAFALQPAFLRYDRDANLA